MWQHEIIEPDDGSETIEYDRLDFGPFWVDILYMSDGSFFVETSDGWHDEEALGYAESLEEAKGLAQRWVMAQIGKLLAAAGAEGVWVVRGAYDAVLGYVMDEDDTDPLQLKLGPPHELIVLARFHKGDGREPGIEMVA